MKKRLFSLLALCGTTAFAQAALSASLANDNASNAAYANNSYDTLNGGKGFLAWAVSGSNNGNANGFFGSYVGGSGLSGRSFSLYSGDVNTGAFANAVRPFNGVLAAGQTFSLDLGHTAVGANGLIGLSLQNSSGATEINLQSNGTAWQINTGAGDVTIAADAANTAFNFTLTYNGGNSYSYTFTGSAGGTNQTATNTISDISQANFFSFQQGADQNFGFDNLSVVPEPGTWATMLLGVGGMAAVILRRRTVIT